MLSLDRGSISWVHHAECGLNNNDGWLLVFDCVFCQGIRLVAHEDGVLGIFQLRSRDMLSDSVDTSGPLWHTPAPRMCIIFA